MPTKRELAIQEARSWIDVPYRHQGRSKKWGCDCAAVVSAIGKVLQIPHEDPRGYSKIPRPWEMRRVLDQYLEQIDITKAQPGDVLVMDFGFGIQHVGILTPGDRLVHCNNRLKRGELRGKVVEHKLTGKWERRIVYAYRFPGIDD